VRLEQVGEMAHQAAGDRQQSFRARGRLITAVILNTLFMAVEVVFAVRAGSLVLFGDAGHNFTDSFSLILSLVAAFLISKPRDRRKTFGYYRSGIIVAFINSLTLILVVFFLFYEAGRRIANPPQVKGTIVIIVAAVGVVINGGVALLLLKGRRDLNIRSAFVHLVGDALVSLGVVITGLLILATGWNIADPIATIVIGLIILFGAFGILRESLSVLMESVPRGLSYKDIRADISGFPGVEDVHDLHIWELGSNIYALSAHVTMASDSVDECQTTLREIKEMLSEKHSITHTTLEMEGEVCGPASCGLD
jgi:cobalt-zinc-cadmium efflux system protein